MHGVFLSRPAGRELSQTPTTLLESATPSDLDYFKKLPWRSIFLYSPAARAVRQTRRDRAALERGHLLRKFSAPSQKFHALTLMRIMCAGRYNGHTRTTSVASGGSDGPTSGSGTRGYILRWSSMSRMPQRRISGTLPWHLAASSAIRLAQPIDKRVMQQIEAVPCAAAFQRSGAYYGRRYSSPCWNVLSGLGIAAPADVSSRAIWTVRGESRRTVPARVTENACDRLSLRAGRRADQLYRFRPSAGIPASQLEGLTAKTGQALSSLRGLPISFLEGISTNSIPASSEDLAIPGCTGRYLSSCGTSTTPTKALTSSIAFSRKTQH